MRTTLPDVLADCLTTEQAVHRIRIAEATAAWVEARRELNAARGVEARLVRDLDAAACQFWRSEGTTRHCWGLAVRAYRADRKRQSDRVLELFEAAQAAELALKRLGAPVPGVFDAVTLGLPASAARRAA